MPGLTPLFAGAPAMHRQSLHRQSGKGVGALPPALMPPTSPAPGLANPYPPLPGGVTSRPPLPPFPDRGACSSVVGGDELMPAKSAKTKPRVKGNPCIEITPTPAEYEQLCRDLTKLRAAGAFS